MRQKKDVRRRRPALLNAALTGGLAILAGNEARAQEAPAQPTPIAAALQEIIVTATRRETSIEDVPYNISAISGASLDRTDTTDLAQLANQIPSFNYEDRGARFAGATVPIMRGLNASQTERPGFIPEQMPVGTYLGNSPVFGYFPFQDIQRVEVLRGPQGTLYGAGALGGAIRLIPNDPKLNDWSVVLEGSGLNTSHSSKTGYSASAILNMPIGSIAALRISGQYQNQPGFIDQFGILARQGNPITGVPVLANPVDVATSPGVYYNQKDVNYTDISNGRIALLLQPTTALKLELATNLSYVQGVNSPQDNPTYAGGASPIDPRITFPATGTYQIVNPTLAPYNRHSSLTSLDASYDVGFATLSSTSSYSETWGVTGDDVNPIILGVPPSYLSYYAGNPINPRFVATSNFGDADHQFTQEVRLVSASGGLIDYVVGLFYDHDRRTLSYPIYEPGTSEQTMASGGSVVVTNPQGLASDGVAMQTFEEKAVFGELTWHITNRWEVTGGGRFFHQNNSQDQTYSSYTIGVSVNTVTSTSVSNQIFKLDTSYAIANNQRVYALFSQGFRRGGTNAFPITSIYQESPAILNYSPDKANNYETGIKGHFENGLRYSADIFYIDWKDPQIGLDTPYNEWRVAVNGKKAESKGVEFEVHTPLFTPNLEATLAYSYVDAKLTESFCLPAGDGTGLPNGFVPCGIAGVSGERLPGTTENDLSATMTYTQPLGAARKIAYTLNAVYRGSSLNSLGTIANNYDPMVLGGYTLVNASAITSLNDHWRIGAYVSNAFDKRAVLGAPTRPVPFLGNLANVYSINTPREISLRVSYSW